MKKILLPWLCLVSAVLANNTEATVYFWDPEGATAPSGGNLAGTWDTASSKWSTSSAQTASPVAWVSGYAADFSAGSATVTTPFIVTVNSAVSIAGIFNGSIGTPGSFVNINGPGSLNLVSGADAFDVGGGGTTVNIPMTGSGQVALENTAKVYFDGTNTYSGGTSIGFPGVASFSGTLIFSNGYAFGTGPIQMTTSGGGAALSMGGTAAMTVTNPFTVANVSLVITSNPGGLTLSGPWALSTTPLIGAAPSGNLIVISGVMSGVGGFTKFGLGTVALSGNNTYSGFTTVSNGVLSVTSDSNLGVAPGVANYELILSGGTLTASNTFTLNQNRLISLTANSTINVASGKTLTYNGTIGGAAAWTKAGNGTLALGNVSAYSGTTTISAGTLEADCQSGSTTSTNSVYISAAGTLSGLGLIGGSVSGFGKIVPGTQAGPATLTFGGGVDLSLGGTYSWNLSSNSTTGGFSTIALNGGNLNLAGASKLSINWTGTATQPSTNNPFWLAPEAWGIVSLNGSAGNTAEAGFANIPNGNYTAGNFTNYPTATGITLLYQPNFAYFNALADAGLNFNSGENLIFTNFSGLSLFVWSSTNATLSVSNWTLVGPMSEQTLANLPGYSRYTVNVNPAVSPTYYIAGNMVRGPYLPPTVTASIVTTPDFVTFTVVNTNVAINAAGVLELVPYPPVVSATASGISTGQFQLQFSAETNINYVVQESGDLINWTNIGNGTVTNSPMTFVDPTATNTDNRFYRVLLP
jgi:autotransporter-associated beta strand protein